MKFTCATVLAALALTAMAATEQYDDLGVSREDNDFWKPATRPMIQVYRVSAGMESLDAVSRQSAASSVCANFDSRDGTSWTSEGLQVDTGLRGLVLTFR